MQDTMPMLGSLWMVGGSGYVDFCDMEAKGGLHVWQVPAPNEGVREGHPGGWVEAAFGDERDKRLVEFLLLGLAGGAWKGLIRITPHAGMWVVLCSSWISPVVLLRRMVTLSSRVPMPRTS